MKMTLYAKNPVSNQVNKYISMLIGILV